MICMMINFNTNEWCIANQIALLEFRFLKAVQICNMAFELDVSKPLYIIDLYFGMVEEFLVEYCHVRKKLWVDRYGLITMGSWLIINMFFWYNLNFHGDLVSFM